MKAQFADILRSVGDYYSAQLRRFGPTPLGVDWSSEASQRLRFDVLLQMMRVRGRFSLIDYGCGYGAFADHLWLRGLGECDYVGCDVSRAMLDAARHQPHRLVRRQFIGSEEPLPVADYCVASGVFNVSLGIQPEIWFQYVTHVWDKMERLSRIAFAFNCLSTYTEPDRRNEHLLYYADPRRVFDHCKRAYSPHVALLHDYPLDEFTVIVRKQPLTALSGARDGAHQPPAPAHLRGL